MPDTPKTTRWMKCCDHPELTALLRNMRPATKAELRAQRRSWVAAEAAFGSDTDEAAYRAAVEHEDKAEIARLDAEAEARRQQALKRMDENDV